MNRKEFCQYLSLLRKESGLKMKELCFTMNTMPTTIYRLECGASNFNVNMLFIYLNALHAQLVIYNEKSTVVVTEYSQLIEWLVSARKNGYTQRKLAEAIGISHDMIVRIESNRSKLSIDIFLKIIEVLGYNIKIEFL